MFDGIQAPLLFCSVLFFEVFQGVFQAGKRSNGPGKGGDVDLVDPSEAK